MNTAGHMDLPRKAAARTDNSGVERADPVSGRGRDGAWIDIDATRWRDAHGRKPFTFCHGLADHPLLTHDAILELVGRLPARLVEMNTAGLPVVMPEEGSPPLDRSPVELARRIEELGRWMAVHNLEIDEDMSRLLDECLDPVAEAIGDFEGGMGQREAYLFLSAGGATTPVHLDFEHNLFLQIAGTKEISTGFVDDRLTTRTLEEMTSGRYGRLPTVPQDTTVYRLEPGDGLYISPSLAHSVKTAPGAACISLSLVFHTPALDRWGRVLAANHDMRRLGITPRNYGRSQTVDAAKSAAVLAWRRLRAALPR